MRVAVKGSISHFECFRKITTLTMDDLEVNYGITSFVWKGDNIVCFYVIEMLRFQGQSGQTCF